MAAVGAQPARVSAASKVATEATGITYLCSLDEHLFAALLLDLVALWLLGQTWGFMTCLLCSLAWALP